MGNNTLCVSSIRRVYIHNSTVWWNELCIIPMFADNLIKDETTNELVVCPTHLFKLLWSSIQWYVWTLCQNWNIELISVIIEKIIISFIFSEREVAVYSLIAS